MGIKEEIISINLNDLHWEQKKIKNIIKKLKSYSTIREKLEVSLIHIEKNELELAKKDLYELKSSQELDNIIESESKKGFFASLSGLFKKTAVATAVAGSVIAANPANIEAKQPVSIKQVSPDNNIQREIDRIGADIELRHMKEAKVRLLYLKQILTTELKKADSKQKKIINNHLSTLKLIETKYLK